MYIISHTLHSFTFYHVEAQELSLSSSSRVYHSTVPVGQDHSLFPGCCGLPHSLQHTFVSDPIPPPNHCTVSLDLILSLYIWRHHVTLKWWCQPTNLNSVKTQRTANI